MKISLRLLLVAALPFAIVTFARAAASPDPKPFGYTVTVDVHADETGKPETVQVYSSDDSTAGKVLEKMALVMAGKVQLPPRLKEGKPVKFTARAPFFFPIESDEGPDSDKAPKPRLKEARMPVYPPDLRDRGVVGGAVLELAMDAQGKLANVKTLRASHPEFEAAATESIQQWTFSPAMVDGKPVPSRVRVAIVFETEESMADLKWRVAPRPSLGSYVVIRPNQPLDAEGKPVAPAVGIELPAGLAPAK